MAGAETAEAPVTASEAGEAYTGFTPPADTDNAGETETVNPSGTKVDDETVETETEETTEGGETAETKAETPEPQAERFARIERENAELKGKMDLMTRFIESREAAERQKADANKPQTVAKYKQLIREQVEAGGDKAALGLIEKFMDAMQSENAERLSRLEQQFEGTKQIVGRSAATAAEREAMDAMKAEYGATDEELKAARDFAKTEYQRASRGEIDWPGDYSQLFERSLFRQRHQGKKAAGQRDKEAEKRRLAAQQDADPNAGTKPAKKGPDAEVPEAALKDFRTFSRWAQKQGHVVPD